MTLSNPPLPYVTRQTRLATALVASGLDALALNAGPSLTYLTGLNFHLSERPAVAIFVPHEPISLIIPEFETGKYASHSFPAQIYPYSEDPATWAGAFQAACKATQLSGRRVGVEPRRFRVLELRLLEAGSPQTSFLSAEELVASIRMYKDDSEVAAMRQAVGVAQDALRATLPLIKPGVRERELASELTAQILRHGSDAELPFAPIFASGSNSANPHAFPTERQLASGDLLILDWGASVGGYFSDLTRTFTLGEPDPELAHIAQIVLEANTAARARAKPGVLAGQVDGAARSVIEKAGYGAYFTHRTGHGLGLEAHEEPYIRAGNRMSLEPGMAFTIEPGIYLPGRGGVRIEDNIVITATGSECLSDLPRGLEIIST